MTIKISACLVIYNEEKVIKRCLDSLKDAVDEIIIVHDGPCSDKTLDICRKYTKKIFIRDRVGEAEPHRPFCLEQASGEWVLTIDADEYMTEEFRKNIRKLVENKSVDGYTVIWPLYHKGKKITFGPLSRLHRLALFRKDKTTISGVVHDWYNVSGNIKGVDFVLEHRPLTELHTYKLFKKKDIKWAFVQAKHLIKNNKAKHPAFFYAIKAVIWFTLIFPYFLILKILFIYGFLGIRMSFLEALYNFYVNWYIFKIKLRKN
jgi:glycosyltransferase involved in cell wall biosynthesis